MLSRVSTGMVATQHDLYVPTNRLSELVNMLKNARSANTVVAKYASEDMNRFVGMIQ